MANRTGNYCAFYVAEPFNQNNLGANAAKDFCYYNLLKAWKAADTSFPFVDSHNKTYSVRDGRNLLQPSQHQGEHHGFRLPQIQLQDGVQKGSKGV